MKKTAIRRIAAVMAAAVLAGASAVTAFADAAPDGSTDATSATGTAPASSSDNSTAAGSNGAAIKTGAESYIIMIALIAAIGGAGVFCFFRRKRDIAE